MAYFKYIASHSYVQYIFYEVLESCKKMSRQSQCLRGEPPRWKIIVQS